MKILVVVPALRSGGAERTVSILTREWAKSHQVAVALFDASNIEYGYGGRVIDVNLHGSKSLLRKVYNFGARSVLLMSLIRRDCPDRIISFTESANLPVIVAAALTGYLDRLYVSVHCNPTTLSRPYRVLIPFLYRLAGSVISVSSGVKQNLASMGLPVARISAVPNPVVARNKRIRIKESVSPMSARYVLGVGRLHRVKGFDRLLQAFRRLERPEVRLVILGEGSERLNLIHLARDLGVEEYVHLPGRVVDVDPWYRHAECFVLSSRHEAWPNVLMEAMVNECPVVSFDCNYGPSEIVQGGESGLLVPEGDVETMALSIATILDDKALRHRLSEGGRKRAQNYYVEEIAPRWLCVNGIDD